MKQTVELGVEILRKNDQLAFTRVFKGYNIKTQQLELFAIAEVTRDVNAEYCNNEPGCEIQYSIAAISVETDTDTPLPVNFICNHSGMSSPTATWLDNVNDAHLFGMIPQDATSLTFSKTEHWRDKLHPAVTRRLKELVNSTAESNKDNKTNTEEKANAEEKTNNKKTASSSPSFFRRAAPAILATAGLIGGTLGIIAMITDSRKKP